MKLENLKTGMIVTLRCGLTGMVMRDMATGMHRGDVVILRDDDWINLNRNFDSGMNCLPNAKYSIDKVEVLKCGDMASDFFCCGSVEKDKVWERETPLELTLADVERAFGRRVKIVDI